MTKRFLSVAILLMMASLLPAQDAPKEELPEKHIKHNVEGWLGLYTKYRLAPKWYYYGEYHYRRRDNFQSMANIYLRFGVTHIPNPNMEFTAGVVTPFYWAKKDQLDDPNVDNVVPQFRFWQQTVFVMRFDRAKVYHQVRTEQRWAKKNYIDAPFKLTFRFRYKISTYIPLNHDHLVPGTLFLSAYEEIFMQAGKSILFNHFEDNRMFVGLGYIINNQIQVQAGYMWTYRHAGSPYEYESRHIPRLSFYHNLDFYQRKVDKLKRRNSTKILRNQF